MKLILSPAKKMRIDRDFLAPRTKPEFLEKTGKTDLKKLVEDAEKRQVKR